VPADKAIQLGIEARRVAEEWERRSRVSEIVVAGEEVRRAIRDSIAAIGGVRSGSAERSKWYLETMSNGWESCDGGKGSDMVFRCLSRCDWEARERLYEIRLIVALRPSHNFREMWKCSSISNNPNLGWVIHV
jgi:hypothetical protein